MLAPKAAIFLYLGAKVVPEISIIKSKATDRYKRISFIQINDIERQNYVWKYRMVIF